MPAINFQPRFADLVESGKKLQTIRKTNRFKIGDTVTLYTGQRTKQCRALGEGVIYGVQPIKLLPNLRIDISGCTLTLREADALAQADGFMCKADMLEWFKKMHGLPFDGWLIRWRLNR